MKVTACMLLGMIGQATAFGGATLESRKVPPCLPDTHCVYPGEIFDSGNIDHTHVHDHTHEGAFQPNMPHSHTHDEVHEVALKALKDLKEDLARENPAQLKELEATLKELGIDGDETLEEMMEVVKVLDGDAHMQRPHTDIIMKDGTEIVLPAAGGMAGRRLLQSRGGGGGGGAYCPTGSNWGGIGWYCLQNHLYYCNQPNEYTTQQQYCNSGCYTASPGTPDGCNNYNPPTPYPTRYPTYPTPYPTYPTPYPTYPTPYPTYNPPTRYPTRYPTPYPTNNPYMCYSNNDCGPTQVCNFNMGRRLLQSRGGGGGGGGQCTSAPYCSNDGMCPSGYYCNWSAGRRLLQSRGGGGSSGICYRGNNNQPTPYPAQPTPYPGQGCQQNANCPYPSVCNGGQCYPQPDNGNGQQFYGPYTNYAVKGANDKILYYPPVRNERECADFCVQSQGMYGFYCASYEYANNGKTCVLSKETVPTIEAQGWNLWIRK